MNETPRARYIVGVPSSTSRPTRLTFSTDPITGQIYAWTGHVWVELVELSVGAVDIYADAVAGNDANPGTASAPVKTLARATAMLPAAWSDRCRIHLAAGNYTFPPRFSLRASGVGEPPVIQGTTEQDPAVPGTRTATGIVTNALDRLEVRDNTLSGLAVDGYVGWFVRFTSGFHAGMSYAVYSNAADGTFKIMLGNRTNFPWWPDPLPGDHFVLERPASIITASPTDPLDVFGAMFGMRSVRLHLAAGVYAACIAHTTLLLDACWITGEPYQYLLIVDSTVVVGTLRSDDWGPTHTYFQDLPAAVCPYPNGLYVFNAVLQVTNTRFTPCASLLTRGTTYTYFGDGSYASIVLADLVVDPAMDYAALSAFVNSTIFLGTPVGYGPHCSVEATVSGTWGAIEINDGSQATLAGTLVRNHHAAGPGIRVRQCPYCEVDGVDNLGGPSGTYGVAVSARSYLRVLAATASGAGGDVEVDGAAGTWAEATTTGLIGHGLSVVDTGAPTAPVAGKVLTIDANGRAAWT